MKRIILLGIACLSSLLLMSCANHNSAYYKAQVRNDMVSENWINHVTLSNETWTRNADKWFYTDEPRNFNEFESQAPVTAAVTAMMVRVPDFTNISIAGPYRVQIYGGQMHNTLYILGPNESARHVAVEIKNNSLVIHPATECGKACGNPNDVIVRIGVRELSNLVANGSGMIEGKLITSSGLTVKSMGKNEILLTGQMALRELIQGSQATISVIGAYSPELDVKVLNSGTVNISGRVGVRHIVKQSTGNLNIIGADSDGLDILSAGSGMTTINGFVNLRHIVAKDSSRVYIYWVNSNGVYIKLNGNSRIGLAGNARNMDVEVAGNARFEGKYFRADTVYVTARDYSHANVMPRQKLFANAMDNSSIYFFGSPNVVSRYTSGNAIIIPVFNDFCPLPASKNYKDETPFASSSPYKDESFSPAYYHKKTHHRKHQPYSYKNESPY
jgi:hypothetical protein